MQKLGSFFSNSRLRKRSREVEKTFLLTSTFDLDVRDYNLWRNEQLPVIMVLFDAGTRRAYWVHVQRYFANSAKRPRKKAKTVRVLVGHRQVFSHRAVNTIRALKAPVPIRLMESTDG